MYGGSVGIVAVCALVASSTTTALVVPATPGNAFSQYHHDAELRPTSLRQSTRHRIAVPCHSCDFSLGDHDHDYDQDDDDDDLAENDDDLLWTQGNGRRQLSLDFSISKDGRRLQLDGEPIFPSKYFKSSAHGGRPIYIIQSPFDASNLTPWDLESQRVPLEVTAFGVVASESTIALNRMESGLGDGDRLLRVQFHLTSLEKQVIDADEVVIHLLRNGKGGLEIVDLEHAPSEDVVLPPSPGTAHPPPASLPPSTNAECIGLGASLCNFRKAVETKIASLRNKPFPFSRPCPGGRGPRISGGPAKFAEFDIPPPPPPPSHHHHGGPPHHHGPPPPGGPHHPHHFLHTLARAAIAVLIPVMAGITTGLLVSLLGLMIGRAIGYVWIKLFGFSGRQGGERGRSTRCSCRRARASRRHAARNGEDKMLLAEAGEIDPPPVYENAPAYSELESAETAAAAAE